MGEGWDGSFGPGELAGVELGGPFGGVGGFAGGLGGGVGGCVLVDGYGLEGVSLDGKAICGVEVEGSAGTTGA